ncbi:MAG: cytochrome c [Proteobacteria bacterium]|nr:cytochrome c [Pseudomonadota bacterium]
MKLFIKLILLSIFLYFHSQLVLADTDEEQNITISKAPASLKQWYQPTNKEQVWLNTMYNLRRQMQAIGEYAAYEDKQHLVAWSKRFSKDYNSIGKMVPEWADELESEWVSKLVTAAQKGDFKGVTDNQRKIAKTCGGCHKEYRATTAAQYRAPDFDKLMIEDGETMEELSIKQSMTGLGLTLERMKIAFEDERPDVAGDSFELFNLRLEDLTTSCSSCHKTDKQRDYLFSTDTTSQVEKLSTLIEAKKLKEGHKLLSKIEQDVCTTCHSIHRTLADVSEFINK